MKYFLALCVLGIASVSAQEPSKPAPAANPGFEIRRATAVSPISGEPEVRRALPADPALSAEIPIPRAVAVSPEAMPAPPNSAPDASQTNPHIPTDIVQPPAQAEIPRRSYSTPSPTIVSADHSAQSQNEETQAEAQSPPQKPDDLVVEVGLIVALIIFLFTVIMLAICLKKDIFLFLNQWDIALSLILPFILIFAINASTQSDQAWAFLLWAAFGGAMVVSLFTGWNAAGSISLSLLLLVPKIAVVCVGAIFGILAVFFSILTAMNLADGKKREAAKSAALTAGTGVGAMKIKSLIDRLTRD